MKKPFIFAVLLFVSTALFAQDAHKDKAIRQLLELTGAKKLGSQIITQLINSSKIENPDVPDDLWERCKAQLSIDSLTEQIIPLYAKYYTTSEIEQLIKFYQSPVGQKVVSTMPYIMKESMEIGEQYGMRAMQKLADQLEAEGYFDKLTPKTNPQVIDSERRDD